MTTETVPSLLPSDAAPFVPPGRPVPRFVIAVAVVATMLAGVGFAGPFSSRVDMWIPAWNLADDEVTAILALTNTGRFTVEVTDFEADELRRPLPLREYVLKGAGDDFEAGEVLGPVSIDPGETVNVTIVLTCADRLSTEVADIGFDQPTIGVDVALGLHRRAVTNAGFSFGTTCPT